MPEQPMDYWRGVRDACRAVCYFCRGESDFYGVVPVRKANADWRHERHGDPDDAMYCQATSILNTVHPVAAGTRGWPEEADQ